MIKVNGHILQPTIFPDNTSQVWNIPQEVLENKFIKIIWEYNHEGELFHLLQLNDILKINKPKQKVLEMDYLPYARQDKHISNQASFALHTFANVINSMEFDNVQVLDAHSSVASNIINNFVDIFPQHQIDNAIKETESDTIALPDAGAYARYGKKYLNYPQIIGNKKRNQQTGYIEEYTFTGDVKDKKVLIIDDICDGGMTFRLLARDLLKNGAKEVNLYVSHGIFSKGLDVLYKDGVNKILTSKGKPITIKSGVGIKYIGYKPEDSLYTSELT